MKRTPLLYCCFNSHIWRLTLLLIYTFAFGQDSIQLSYESYMQAVLAEHPIAKQANLQLDLAQAEQLGARGNFDPVLYSDWNEKYFKEAQYYRNFRTELSVPTGLGLTFKAGYENNAGDFLNNQNSISGSGLWDVGLEANLLQGLLIDERRASLRQAAVFSEMAANERRKILNDLFLNASYAYVDWQKYHENRNIIIEAQGIARQYFEFTKESYEGGVYPAIDTLEAFLVVQDRDLLYQKNEAELIKARRKLENFLWYNQIPQELRSSTYPELLQETEIPLPEPDQINNWVNQHPEVIEKELKLRSLDIDNRLKRDKLKPKLKLKYSPLLATTNESIRPEYDLANYKWGFGFEFPLFLRSERAGIQQNEIKRQTVRFDLDYKRLDLQNKIEANLERQELLNQQIDLQLDNLNNYSRLLEGEQTKFRFGESSVFLLNKRQEKYIDSQMKFIELQAKFNQELIQYLYLTNQFLADELQ